MRADEPASSLASAAFVRHPSTGCAAAAGGWLQLCSAARGHMLHVNRAARHLACITWQWQPFNEPAAVFPGPAKPLQCCGSQARECNSQQGVNNTNRECATWAVRGAAHSFCTSHRRQRVLPWFAATGRAAFRSAVTAPLPLPQFYPLHCASLRHLALVCEQRLCLRRGRLRINGAGLGAGEGAAGSGKLHAPPQLQASTERGGAREGSVQWCAGGVQVKAAQAVAGSAARRSC